MKTIIATIAVVIEEVRRQDEIRMIGIEARKENERVMAEIMAHDTLKIRPKKSATGKNNARADLLAGTKTRGKNTITKNWIHNPTL